MDQGDIIVAPATPAGGAIAIIRLSGEGSIALCDKVFKAHKSPLCKASTHTLHYGDIVDNERIIDDVLVSIFRAPHSYTGEESVEISCHGSSYVMREIITLLIRCGARSAEAGEFTTRAYLAGRMDLAQAEAVADIIASTSRAQHAMATTQMRGRYSERLTELRSKLIETAALLELELDFSQEDVEFADRTRLSELMSEIGDEIATLSDSFSVGNAIKEGVAVAIIGEPNVGKSTLLNRLLGDERAMVSDIAGTTRDLIEEQITLDGVTYRFIDTAGVHKTTDRLEQMGIERTYSAIDRAQIIIHITDATTQNEGAKEIDNLSLRPDQKLIHVINKVDLTNTLSTDNTANATIAKESEHVKKSGCAKESELAEKSELTKVTQIEISAKKNIGIEQLLDALNAQIGKSAIFAGAPIVSSTRHYELLVRAQEALKRAQGALNTNLSTDLLCQDLREVLHHIGAITATITTNDLLTEIFSKFCIGK